LGQNVELGDLNEKSSESVLWLLDTPASRTYGSYGSLASAVLVKVLMEPSSRLNNESTVASAVSSGNLNSKLGLARKCCLTSVWYQPENHQLPLLRYPSEWKAILLADESQQKPCVAISPRLYKKMGSPRINVGVQQILRRIP